MKDKRIVRGEETYNRIIDAALNIISEDGLSGISAAKISARAGVSKSNIFHHFESTTDIPMVVLERLLTDMIVPAYQMDVSTIGEMLTELEHIIFNTEDGNDIYHRVFLSFYHGAMNNETYRDIMGRFINDSVEIVSERLVKMSSRQISKDQAEGYAKLILTTMDGIGVHMMVSQDYSKQYDSWLVLKKLIIKELSR